MSASDRVSLTVPSRSEYARTARLTAAELAARTGMNIDQVDDMKLAVEEAFVYAARQGQPDVTFSFTVSEKEIEVFVGPLAGSCSGPEDADAEERYARFILAEVCDEFDVTERDGACYLRLVKRTD